MSLVFPQTEKTPRASVLTYECSCERENKWLDESSYAVDISILPRGGSRRRKSMQPRALLNINGSLSAAPPSTSARRSLSAEMNRQMRDELVNTPVRGSAGAGAGGRTKPPQGADDEADWEDEDEDEEGEQATGVGQATPTGFVDYDPATSQTPGGVGASPTTPYYLSQGAKLVQMTCPPKQIGRGLFDEQEEEDDDEGRVGKGKGKVKLGAKKAGVEGEAQKAMRKRLMEARRRTLGWRPVVASPLGRE